MTGLRALASVVVWSFFTQPKFPLVIPADRQSSIPRHPKARLTDDQMVLPRCLKPFAECLDGFFWGAPSQVCVDPDEPDAPAGA